jgi:hypothetical protein
MKVWVLYYTGNLDDISYQYGDDDERSINRLYGFTNNKGILRKFLDERNPDVFKVKKLDMLPSEFEDFSREFRGASIELKNLLTRDDNKLGHSEVTMALTDYEYQVVSDDDMIDFLIMDDAKWITSVNPKRYNEKIQKALETLQYTSVYKLVKNTDDEDYSAPDILIDELSMFITNFSGTLKI